jgi:hypothetical protein
MPHIIKPFMMKAAAKVVILEEEVDEIMEVSSKNAAKQTCLHFHTKQEACQRVSGSPGRALALFSKHLLAKLTADSVRGQRFRTP